MRALRYMAKVPQGGAFAPNLRTGLKNTAQVAFNPYLGKHMQWPKRVLQGATVWGAGQAVAGAREHVQNMGTVLDQVLPAKPQTQGLKNWARELKDWPVWTSARTALFGLPDSVPTTQKDLLRSVANVGTRAAIHHSGGASTWADMLKSVYSPAAAPTTSALKQVARTVVAPPKPKDYADLLRAVFDATR